MGGGGEGRGERKDSLRFFWVILGRFLASDVYPVTQKKNASALLPPPIGGRVLEPIADADRVRMRTQEGSARRETGRQASHASRKRKTCHTHRVGSGGGGAGRLGGSKAKHKEKRRGEYVRNPCDCRHHRQLIQLRPRQQVADVGSCQVGDGHPRPGGGIWRQYATRTRPHRPQQ